MHKLCGVATRSLRTARGPRASRRIEPIARQLLIPKSNPGPLSKTHDEKAIKAGSILDHPTLVITRQIEMMNIFVGFEQANKYVMYDSNGSIIGGIAELDSGFGGTMMRNLAGTHRSFSCSVLDAQGNEILTVKRGFAVVNSYIRIYRGDELLGEVRQVFHFLRRKYELYRHQDGDMVQFGVIDEPTLSWDFSIKDEDGNVLGSISRNLRGLVRELFSDTGMYVVRLSQSSVLQSTEIVAQGENEEARNAIIATQARELVGNPRDLSDAERAVVLGTAIAVDFDYFSKMSNSHGIGMPMMMPVGYGTGAESTPTTQQDVPASPPVPGQVSNTEQDLEQGPKETGNWWDEQPSEQPQETNWWDQQSEGSWLDGFDDE